VCALGSGADLVDVGHDTTACDGGLHEMVQLLITANGELQVTRSDTLHLLIFRGVAGQLQAHTTNKSQRMGGSRNDRAVRVSRRQSSMYANAYFEHFGAEVFENGGAVDSGRGTDAVVGLHAAFQVSVNTTDRELHSTRVGGRGRRAGRKKGALLVSPDQATGGQRREDHATAERRTCRPARVEREIGFFLPGPPPVLALPLPPANTQPHTTHQQSRGRRKERAHVCQCLRRSHKNTPQS
jgi:hypothetical protein